ncbi:MAG: hypothetical protein MCSN_3280 [Candidatus Microsyncoccus archaeolyticus]|nr:MAG: hypothetical protein MCSN_3280 [Candidatus Parcubacteria bacterium]
MIASSFNSVSEYYFSLNQDACSSQKLSTLEKLIDLSKTSEELEGIRYEVQKLRIIKNRREMPKRFREPFVEEIEKLIKKFEEKEIEIGANNNYSFDLVQIKTVEQGMSFFLRSQGSRRRSEILLKIDKLELPFKDWQKAFLNYEKKSRTLRKFFFRKLEENACFLKDFIYVYAASRGADKKGLHLKKILPLIQDEKSWKEIKEFCRKDRYIISEVSPELLIQELERLRKEYLNN